MVEKKINDQVNKVVGGMIDENEFKFQLKDLKFHFGCEFDKYQSEKHIGEKVIVKLSNIFVTDYFVGILSESKEGFSFFGTKRIVTIIDEKDQSKYLQFYDPDCLWTYVS